MGLINWTGQVVLDGITKYIGYRPILKQVSLTLYPKNMAILTGHNGAGKTTLLRIIARITAPSQGKIYGVNPKQIGYLGHHHMMYDGLTCWENLLFFRRFYGAVDRFHIQSILEELGLAKYKSLPVAHLSRGMQQRLALGRILLCDAKLILMDEPFTGLDIGGQQWLIALLRNLQSKGLMVMVVSHGLANFRSLSYRHLTLDKGCLVDHGLVNP